MRGKENKKPSKKRSRQQAGLEESKASKKMRSDKGYLESIYNLEEYLDRDHQNQIEQII